MRSSLPLRPLGGTFQTTLVGFGGGAISGEGGGYGFGAITEQASVALLESAWDAGIRLYDTAPIYGFGTSEERLGRFLAAHPERREEMVLVSKLGVTWDSSRRVYTSNKPEVVRRMLEESLVRLGTDHLDVYFIHWPDADTPVEETMEALARAKEQGKIRAIGVSNFDVALLRRAQRVAPVEVLQNRFSLLENSVRSTLFPEAARGGLGFMAYGPLGKGLLAGSVAPGRTFDAFDFRSRGKQIFSQYEAAKETLARVRAIAGDLGVSMTQLALAWAWSHPELSVTLTGSRTREQLAEVAGAARIALDASVKAELDALSDAVTPAFLEA